ncbi:unnamed protein product [Paramecium primaurelia]|uniref:Phosphatidic acid phosphatase type 2/haloperoxidase domain-containing protein n=1 Tax=Paramecium primaurelia TaxID=5886 RepID=A0A8S1NVF3_PARPR|nr:unnamed protein product [Paramecium primaurelia]
MKLFIIATIALFLYIAIDLIFNQEMWDANTSLTLYLQQNQFPGEKDMFLVFSYSLFLLPSIAGIAFLVLDNKLGALLYGWMILFSAASNSFLKNLYHQARPYFIVQEIEPYECNKEFGKPSGHAMSSSAMCFLLPCILFPAIWKDQPNYKYPLYIRVIVIFIITFWTFMTGFSRVFMGVHSFGQIILGWVYQAYISIIYMIYIHDKIMTYLTECLQMGHKGISIRVIQIIGLIAFSWTCVAIIFLELNRYVFISPAEATLWMTAVYEKCENQTTLYTIDSPLVLQNICFSMSLYIWIMVSFVIGIKLSKGIYLENQFRYHYKSLYLWQKTLRIFILIILIALLIPFFLIEFNSVYAQAFGQIIPVSILGGLIITVVYSKILYYLKISVPGDFLQIIYYEQSAPDGMSFELQAKSS